MEPKEEFVSIKPKNSLIAEHISYYYFQKTFGDNFLSKVIYYPHYGDALNFYKNADVTWDDTGRIIKATKKDKITCLYTCNRKKSRTVTMIGVNNKIGIIFNPLGLNHFIQCSLGNITPDLITTFNYFGNSFFELANNLYNENELSTKRDLLDSYFLERYIGFEDGNFKAIIKKIVKNPDFKVEEIASQLHVTRKTILRKFKQHLCLTPRDFKSLLKFRKALNLYEQHKERVKLTDITYDSSYYDQADFIKHYKSLVDLTPKQLFSKITKYGINNTFWTRIEE